MVGLAEAFALADKLGLDFQAMFDISSQIVRPMLGADRLLPGAGPGAELAGEPGL